MMDLKKLAEMLKELDDSMVACMRCGMCQSVCPVFAETMREADVTRGKIALLENLAHEMIKDPKSVQERLHRCLLCGSCAVNCPSGVQIMDIFLRARLIITAYRGLSPIKKLILRGLVSNPQFFNKLLSMGANVQGVFSTQANPSLGSSCSKILSPFIGPRHFSPLAKTPLHKKHQAMDTPKGESGLKVLFYPGCLGDKMYTAMAEACLKVFQHHGVGVYMPDAQACCGLPALSSGDRAAYDKVVRYNVDLFSKSEFDYIVSPCASCVSAIKELWSHMEQGYSEDVKQRITEYAAKTMDISQFVVDILGVRPEEESPGETRVTYHDPCHLKKSLGVYAQPRDLLRMNKNHTLVEMNEADRCCGCGGTFNLQHYDLSSQIGHRKRDNIVASGAQVVATACPACMMQLVDALSQHDDDIQVKHCIEIYAETLD